MAADLLDNVNAFMGVDGGGACLPGPHLPRGMVRVGPDVRGHRSASGYASETPILGFSQTHIGGSGGGGRYGNIRLVPVTGTEWSPTDAWTPVDEVARPGYYEVRLEESGVTAELSATAQTAVHRYSFPGASARLVVDLGSAVRPAGAPPEELAVAVGGYLEKDGDREIICRSDIRGGWGNRAVYSVYAAIQCDAPISSTVVGHRDPQAQAEARPTDPVGFSPDFQVYGAGSCALLTFDGISSIEVRVGISFVSIANAREALENESRSLGFSRIRRRAEDRWRSLIGRIAVSGGTERDTRLFTSALYRLFCMPTDLGDVGENPLWRSSARQFNDIICLWDSVRNANSLFTLVDPEYQIDLLRFLLDVSEHTGWLPDAWVSFHSSQIQGGSSADVLFGEAALKAIPDVDYGRVLDAVLRNSSSDSPDPRYFGRYRDDYESLGYLPADIPNGVSRTIEYSYQDWCAARLAEAVGRPEHAQRLHARSRRFWNVWRADLGCAAPRHRDGSWVEPFDPYHPTRPDYWFDPFFYEGVAHEWTLTALHAIPGIIREHGGAEGFSRHLDAFFSDGIYHWKEIILHTPYLYHAVGRPDRVAEVTRKILDGRYAPERNGFPDNEDMGANATFVVCTMIGLYPVMGQDLYLLSPPRFPDVRMTLPLSGGELHITAGPWSAGGHTSYICGAQLDGVDLNRQWLRHAEIAGGGHLHLTLSSEPSTFGAGNPPPFPDIGPVSRSDEE